MVPEREEWLPAAAALGVAVLVVVAAAFLSSQRIDGGEAPSAGWIVVHEDSRAVFDQPGDAWQETFRLHAVPAEFVGTASGRVQVLIDSEQVDGTWDRPLAPCARFEATVPARDFLVPIQLVVDGAIVWSGTFGSGSGTPLDSGCR